MSWQCPICETVNQDITPVCAVCDHLAPVVDSYLSLESIENIRDYNDKLEKIHALEVSKNYETMLEIALEAMATYKDNGLAVEKARQAIKKLHNFELNNFLVSKLEEVIVKKNLLLADALIKIYEHFEIVNEKFEEIRKEVKKKLSRKKDVDELLKQSFDALIELDSERAMKIVEEGLLIHTNSKRLQTRRREIQIFIQNLNKKKENEALSKNQKLRPKQRISSQDLNKSKSDTKKNEKRERRFPEVRTNKN